MYGIRRQDWLLLGDRERETRGGYKEGFWGANVPFADFGTSYITVFHFALFAYFSVSM